MVVMAEQQPPHHGSDLPAVLDRELLTISDIVKHNRIILKHYHQRSNSVSYHGNPTTSYGLIVLSVETGRWVLVQRKHSAEFLVLIRGYYRLVHLPLLISKLMPSEVEHLKRAIAQLDYFEELYLKVLCQAPDGLSYARLRFSELLELLPGLFSKIDVSSNTLSWSWPKGRPLVGHHKEDSLVAAKREFTEEVEVELPPPLLVSDQLITEQYLTIAGKLINAHYWLYLVGEEFPITAPTQHPEVRSRGWYSITHSASLLPATVLADAVKLIQQQETECLEYFEDQDDDQLEDHLASEPDDRELDDHGDHWLPHYQHTSRHPGR